MSTNNVVLTIDNVTESDLPGSVHELIEVVGLTAALQIVEQRGGIRLCVPLHFKEQNWITELIGGDAAKKLIAYYAGEEIDIPRCQSAIKSVQDQAIFEELEMGVSQTTLARKYNYTERGICKLKKRMEEKKDITQASLF